MNRFSTLTLLLLLSLRMVALPPIAQVALREHFAEVNREWIFQQSRMQTLTSAELSSSASFVSDSRRISAHLMYVIAELRARTGKQLSATQRANRLSLLAKLEGYARRGEFPQNLYHRHRQPYFIDHRGVPCAVGYLMQQSGESELAERIQQTMNYAYIREIPYPEVSQWAEKQGFEIDELAWIQPAYPGNYTLSAMDGGTNGPVRSMIQDPTTGDLLVGGGYFMAGGDTSYYFSRWNGSQLTPFTATEPLWGQVNASIIHNGELWVGGAFTGFCGTPPFANVARWNGTSWEYRVIGWGPVYAMESFGNQLYVAGDINNGDLLYSSNVYMVADTGESLPIGTGLNGPIYSLIAHGPGLVAGGAFTATIGGDSMAYLAALPLLTMPPVIDWVQYHGGFDNEVHALSLLDGQLVVGGKLADSAGNATMGLAAEVPGNPGVWLSVPGFGPVSSGDCIHSLLTLGGTVVFGGQFSITQLVGMYGSNIGKAEFYMGHSPFAEPLSELSGPVYALAHQQGKLYVGGEFLTGNYTGDTLNNLCFTDFAATINNIAGTMQVDVAPNPVKNVCRVTLSADANVQLCDVSGKVWMTVAGKKGENSLNISPLPTGTYYLLLTSNTGRIICSRTLLKE